MDKTYVFDTNDKGTDMTSALVAGLMQNKGIDPNLVAMLSNASKNQDAWGGAGFWWIWVIIMFWLWGGNRGGMFGNNGDGIPSALNNDFGREVLLQAINGNGQALSQLATTLNCDINALQGAVNNVQSSIQAVGSQVGMSSQQIINAVGAGNSAIASQIASCCCDVRNAITTQSYENRLATCDQTTALQATMNGNSQAVMAKLDAIANQGLLDKIDALRERNSTLLAQLSTEHQTAAIQAYQAQALVPVNAALQELNVRLGNIECKQPATVSVPYIPAMSNLVPVSYSQPVNIAGC